MTTALNAQYAGKVLLVGAGPGDPELLTFKAAKAISRATVILVDDLVNPAVLSHARAGARIVQVGKRGGCKSTPQAFIEKLMIMAAKEGETVVRLKGGDPFIFGRGGEEVEALQAAGVEVEVINGITSGLAAASALHTPLTHREHAHGVIFITGHAKPGGDCPDWALLSRTAAQAKLSLVVYMGVSGVQHICNGLLVGLKPETPVAVVQHASLPQQRIHHTTLEQLAGDVLRHQLASPSVLLIGDVFAAQQALQSAPQHAAWG
ncbi:MAG: uroporphyrinogen-III C-methyltransferase [Brachymonas sp.]|nr:uroporphyrinogen-III C-methyltransferase [Brachymonas sp.]